MDSELKLGAVSFDTQETKINDLVEEVREKVADYALPLIPRTDLDFIAKFVRAKKYDTDKATDAIKRYYEHIFKYASKVRGLKPSSYKAVFDSQAVAILKSKIQGTHPFYWHVKNWNIKEFNAEDYVTGMMFLVEELAEKVQVQPYGAISIINLDGLGLRHVRQFPLRSIKYFLQLGIDGLPMRIEALHFVNPTMSFWAVHSIIMGLLSTSKIRDRIHVHQNMESLHKFIDRNELPLSLGGVLEEADAMDSELLSKLIANDRCYDEYWSTGPCSCQCQKQTLRP